MLNDLVLFSGDRADNDRLYAQIEQVRNLVRDGLASCASIHVETMGEDQPDLFNVVAHLNIIHQTMMLRCYSIFWSERKRFNCLRDGESCRHETRDIV
jgi:hypothetical protein